MASSVSGTSINATTNQRESPPPAYAPASSRQTPIGGGDSKPKVVKALYEFSSEDGEDLHFKVGDLIEVVESSDQYGWWTGRIKGTQRIGNFPSNYVQKL